MKMSVQIMPSSWRMKSWKNGKDSAVKIWPMPCLRCWRLMTQVILTGCLKREKLKERREWRVRKVNTHLFNYIPHRYLPSAIREAQDISERSRCHVQINMDTAVLCCHFLR